MTGVSEHVNEALAAENERLRQELEASVQMLSTLGQRLNDTANRVLARLDAIERRLMGLENARTTYYPNSIGTSDTWGTQPPVTWQGANVSGTWHDEAIHHTEYTSKTGKKHVDARLDGLEKIKKKRQA